METVIIFAAGDPLPRRLVGDVPDADLVVAANGGHDTAIAMGIRVDLLVGDLDSVDSTTLPDRLLVEQHPADKDATDLELAMQVVLRRQPDRLVVVGGSGGRLDHELAVAQLVCSPRWAEIEEIDWLSGRGRSHVTRGARRLHGDVGAILTLLACGGPATGVTTRGLRWELSAGVLEPGSSLGVSNRLQSPVVDLSVDSGTVLAIFPDG